MGRRSAMLVVVGILTIAPSALAEEEQGPERVLQQFPTQGLEHVTQQPAWEHAKPVVVNNLTKDAREAKADNSQHHLDASGRH